MTFPFGYSWKIFFIFDRHYDDGNSETKMKKCFIKVERVDSPRKFKNASLQSR